MCNTPINTSTAGQDSGYLNTRAQPAAYMPQREDDTTESVGNCSYIMLWDYNPLHSGINRVKTLLLKCVKLVFCKEADNLGMFTDSTESFILFYYLKTGSN